jgi:hypothetical protein
MKVRLDPIQEQPRGGRLVIDGDDDEHATLYPPIVGAHIDDQAWDVHFALYGGEVASVLIERRRDGKPINPRMIRGVRLGEAIQEAMRLAGQPFKKVGDEWVGEADVVLPLPGMHPVRRGKFPTIDAEAEQVAEVYRRVKPAGGDVSRVVGKELGMSRTTAFRRIRRARELGILEVDE